MTKPFTVALLVLALVLGVASVDMASAQTGSESSIPSATSSAPLTPLLSARRFPGALQAASDPELAATLDQYLAKVSGAYCALVELDGRTIVNRDASEALAPASVMKLATATAALDLLGPEFVFTTRFTSNSSPRDGVIHGDLYVVGGGDPLFATPGYKPVFDDPDQFFEDFSLLADSLADAGVTKVEGNLIGDESRYDSVRFIPTWPTRYQIGGTVAPLSALIVNDGSTGYTETPNTPTANRKAGDSPLLFVQTLKTVLAARGIEVTGTTSVGKAPESASEIASFQSVPLTQVLGEMLLDSDNTTAELVMREIGYSVSGSGTTAAGIAAARESLSSSGFDISSLVMIDGSGLDTGNRMSCELGIALVKSAANSPEIATALPLGGRTGTLRKRMVASASTGRVRAKTGTLNSVNALSGFADTPQGSTLTFTFLHNGNDVRTTGVADGFTDRLMTYAKGRKFASLGPVQPK